MPVWRVVLNFHNSFRATLPLPTCLCLLALQQKNSAEGTPGSLVLAAVCTRLEAEGKVSGSSAVCSPCSGALLHVWKVLLPCGKQNVGQVGPSL